MFPSRGDLHVAPFQDEALYMEQINKVNFWYQDYFHGVNLSSLRDAAMKEYFRQPIVSFITRIRQAVEVFENLLLLCINTWWGVYYRTIAIACAVTRNPANGRVVLLGDRLIKVNFMVQNEWHDSLTKIKKPSEFVFLFSINSFHCFRFFHFRLIRSTFAFACPRLSVTSSTSSRPTRPICTASTSHTSSTSCRSE